MSGPQELLFGLNVASTVQAADHPLAAALRAEELGFDFVSASDHPGGDSASYETWTMLTWIAAGTSRIRIATRVLGVPYRNPALVAKMAETLDRLSGGRLILGLGAGSSDDEFRSYGLPVPSPGEKITGLEEAVDIIQGMWAKPSFSYGGRVHHTDGAQLEPKPDHHIPIWLGTFADRGLAVTGRLADGWIPSLGYAPPAQVTVLRDKVRAAAEKAGRDPGEITCAYNLAIWLDEHAEPEEGLVSGGPDQVTEELQGFLDLGFSALNFMPTGPDQPRQAERLAQEVLPRLRAHAGRR